MVIRCAWCGKYRVDSVWVTTDQPPERRETSHGVCPHCFDDLVAPLADRRWPVANAEEAQQLRLAS